MKIETIINPKYNSLKSFIDSIPFKNEDLGEVIYQARNTVFCSVVPFSGPDGSSRLLHLSIKSFKIPPLYNRIAYSFFRKGKAEASYLNAIQLLKLGVNTPEPVACIKCFKNGLLFRSYYICLMVNGNEIRFWERIPDNEPLVRALARLIVVLHDKGIFHRDLSPGNILYDKDFNFNLLDINRMQFNVHSSRTLMLNFQRINGSKDETLRLAQYYAEAKGADPLQIRRLALKAYLGFHAAQRRKNAFKKIISFFK